MRDQNMASEAAIGVDAEMPMVRTQILVTCLAGCAFAAADPGIDRHPLADDSAFSGAPYAFDNPGYLMSESEREWTVLGDIETFLTAKLKVTVLQMQIRVTDATPLDADQDFRALGSWAVDNRFAQRLAVSDKRLAEQFCHRVLLSV